jgi:hypothetical protein
VYLATYARGSVHCQYSIHTIIIISVGGNETQRYIISSATSNEATIDKRRESSVTAGRVIITPDASHGAVAVDDKYDAIMSPMPVLDLVHSDAFTVYTFFTWRFDPTCAHHQYSVCTGIPQRQQRQRQRRRAVSAAVWDEVLDGSGSPVFAAATTTCRAPMVQQ